MGQKIYFNFVNVRKYLREDKETGKKGGCVCHEPKCPISGVSYGVAQSK